MLCQRLKQVEPEMNHKLQALNRQNLNLKPQILSLEPEMLDSGNLTPER